MAVSREFFYTIDHYEYGEPFYGSYKSVSYRLAIEPLENVHWTPVDRRGDIKLRAYVWPGPWSFDNTEEADREFRDFEYSAEGLEEAVRWIDGRCEGAEELDLLRAFTAKKRAE